jgi:hypothetical protein
VNKRRDIVHDILPLSTFVMKGYSARSQVFENDLNVVLRPTCNAYVDIRKTKADKFVDKVEDLFSW